MDSKACGFKFFYINCNLRKIKINNLEMQWKYNGVSHEISLENGD